MSILSEAEQDYIKTIYKLENGRTPYESVTTNLLSNHLQVRPASVTKMIKHLAKKNLLIHEPYKGVKLSRAGEKIAVEIIRHHRLIELYLTEALQMPWDVVHEEAERMEHSISPMVAARMEEMLGYPHVDPHGQPIPNNVGLIVHTDTCALSELKTGSESQIVEVDDDDPEFLRYVADLGLLPQTKVQILSKEPFDGPITIQANQQERIIGKELAQRVYVEKKK